ncbi:MAG: PqqD family protein [Erysipelotrichaceae bacterium]|nr:PqqD family protein [Erysipelotrichaceae bacterium]
MAKKYQAKDGFVARKIAGELLLVPVGERVQDLNGMIYLNETSQFIWDALANPVTIDEIVAKIKSEFNVKDNDVEQDVQQFIDDALTNELIIEI